MAKLVGFLFFFAMATSNALALEGREGNGLRSEVQHEICTENAVTIVGRIQIYGNSPHTFAGIIDRNGVEYAIYPPELERKLRTLQSHLIEFTVVVLAAPQSLILRGGTVTPLKWNILR